MTMGGICQNADGGGGFGFPGGGGFPPGGGFGGVPMMFSSSHLPR